MYYNDTNIYNHRFRFHIGKYLMKYISSSSEGFFFYQFFPEQPIGTFVLFRDRMSRQTNYYLFCVFVFTSTRIVGSVTH